MPDQVRHDKSVLTRLQLIVKRPSPLLTPHKERPTLSCMNKTEVYSWRMDTDLKSALEQVARAEKTSVAQLLDSIVRDWLQEFSSLNGEDEQQQRLHSAAQECFGTLHSGGSDLATLAKERVRQKIRERPTRPRTH